MPQAGQNLYAGPRSVEGKAIIPFAQKALPPALDFFLRQLFNQFMLLDVEVQSKYRLVLFEVMLAQPRCFER